MAGNTAVGLYKSQDGWYMLGIASNIFEDREDEIFPESAHTEYAQWVKNTGFQPALTIFHLPMLPSFLWQAIFTVFGDNVPMLQKLVDAAYKDFGIGTVERVIYVNGFVVVSAKIRDDRKQVVERVAEHPDQGMSHAFSLFKKSGKILAGYRSYEFSILPRMRAANFFTLPMFRKGSMSQKQMSAEDRQYVDGTYPEGTADAIESLTDDAKGRLGEIFDIKSLFGHKDEEITEETAVKEAEEQAEETTETPATEETASEAEESVDEGEVELVAEVEVEPEMLSDEVLKSVAEKMAVALDFSGLESAFKTVIGQVEALSAELESVKAELAATKEVMTKVSKSEDEKVAETIRPIFDWSKSLSSMGASQAKETVVPDEVVSEALAAGPQTEVTAASDVLDVGFWNQLNK